MMIAQRLLLAGLFACLGALPVLAAVPRQKPDIPQSVPAANPARVPEDAPILPEQDLDAAAPIFSSDRESCEIPDTKIEIVEQPKSKDLACEIPDPVLVSGITASGPVALRPRATLDCSMAGEVSQWIRDSVAPAALSLLGSELTGLRVASSYVCRRRNNLPDGKLSEHAFGNAIDISMFRLADGRELTVEDGWQQDDAGKRFLQRIRDSACDRFTTVLGPDADVYHQDHFHLDQGCHGKTCTYRICQ